MERVADYVIRRINDAGVGHIFLVTGRGILYLTDAVARNGKIVPVSTYHEQGASYAAMAYALIRNDMAACLVSTGCAATNAITALLCAYQDNLPIVFVSGNNHLEENSRHTGTRIRTYGSQEADIIRIVEPLTKYAVMLEKAESVAFEVEKALYLAREGRRGPVWIDIPLDVQNMRINESEQEHFVTPHKNKGIIDVRDIVRELNASKRPILLIGGGARSSGKLIKRIIEEYNIPAVFSPAGADIYGAAHELAIGAIGSIGGSRAGNFTIQNSDYVLALGSKLCSQLTGERLHFAREAKVVVVDIDEDEHKKTGVVDRIINCDIAIFLDTLLECQLKKRDRVWADKCIHWKKVFSLKNEPFVEKIKAENKIDLYSLMDELRIVLPDSATIITDAGFEELVIPSAIGYREGQRCIFPAAQGSMGYAIPAVIGAFEAGAKHLCCIVGDGSIMMNIQELQMISARKIPVKILVINNNMYAVIRRRQRDLFRRRTIGNDPSDGVPEPDFESISAAFGLLYRKINNRAELLEALPRLFDGKLEIIEVMCTPEQDYLHESYAINEKKRLIHRPIEDMSPFLPRQLIREEMVINMLEE